MLRPRNQTKLYGSKYQVGQKVKVKILCADTGARQGNKMLVEINGYPILDRQVSCKRYE